ncbi:MAG: TlpA disulfide reductase family protein [Bacteroidia bacterium]
MKRLIVFFCIPFLFTSCKNPSDIRWETISVSNLNGEAVDLSRYEGKRLLINVWATWCGPCRAEMPSMELARQQLEPEGYVFIAISDESWSKIQAFRDQYGYEFEFLRLNDPIKSLGIFSIPQTYIVSSKGKVVKAINGSVDWASKESLAFLQSVP